MGKKAKWFGAVKKVFSPESKAKKEEKSKKKWGSAPPSHPDPSPSASLEAADLTPPPPPLPHPEEVKLEAAAEDGQSKHGSSVATVAAPEAAAASAIPAAVEVAQLASSAQFPGKSREEIAAIKIQTAFRGYLARRALRALKGLVRLKSLAEGNSVKRQTVSTMRCMQILARVQSQIRARRHRMSEENQALQRQLLLQRERELESLRMGEEWDDSLQSKEQIEASLVNRQEAALRRERALAYAFSHQWKTTSRSVNPMFIDPNNPQWGWSWLERWMGSTSKPWESRSAADKDANADHGSVKSTGQNTGEGDITRSYARRDTKPDKVSPTLPKLARPVSRQSPSTPSLKPAWVNVKSKSVTPKNGFGPADDDARSMISIQSERPRRHSIAVSTVRDDESLASFSPSVRSYMVPTESAKAKSRFQSPSSIEKAETPEKGGSAASVKIKKRLSFAAGEKHSAVSPAGMRRHSGPPKVEIAAKDAEVQSEL